MKVGSTEINCGMQEKETKAVVDSDFVITIETTVEGLGGTLAYNATAFGVCDAWVANMVEWRPSENNWGTGDLSSFSNLLGYKLMYKCPSEAVVEVSGESLLGAILVGVALWVVMQLPQFKCIQYCRINQAPEHLQPPPLVPSGHKVVTEELIKRIYATHVGVVVTDHEWLLYNYFLKSAIPLLSPSDRQERLTMNRRYHKHISLILPSACCHPMALKEKGLIYTDVSDSRSQSRWHVDTVISNCTHSQRVMIQKMAQ